MRCSFAFAFAGREGDDICAARHRELGQQQADATTGRVHQHIVASAHGITVGAEELRGQALQQHSRGGIEGDVFGQADEFVHWYRDEFGVRIRAVGERDALAKLPVARCVARMQFGDCSCGLVTGDPWWRPGEVIAALATINVGEVQADCRGAHDRDAGSGDGVGQGGPLQDIGSAETGEGECVHGRRIDRRTVWVTYGTRTSVNFALR